MSIIERNIRIWWQVDAGQWFKLYQQMNTMLMSVKINEKIEALDVKMKVKLLTYKKSNPLQVDAGKYFAFQST